MIDERTLESAITEIKEKAEKQLLNDAQLIILSAIFFAEPGRPRRALDLIEFSIANVNGSMVGQIQQDAALAIEARKNDEFKELGRGRKNKKS